VSVQYLEGARLSIIDENSRMMMYDDPGSLVRQSRSVEEVVEKVVCTVD
jgi:hypothetical protein